MLANNFTSVLKLLLAILIVLTAFYLAEKIFLQFLIKRIPLRIAVTGTRGKSSVTRLIAAGLSAGGYRTLAKTTGSKAVTILPSGAEVPIHRRGFPSILEQKMMLKLAAREHVDALVVEVMSIQPETYAVELQKILRPSIVVITNVRLDHVEALGETLEQASLVFAMGIPRNCQRVVLLKEDCPETLLETLRRRGIRTYSITKDTYKNLLAEYTCADYYEWENNLVLALATCDTVGISPEKALAGMAQVHPDFGALRIWAIPTRTSPWFAVNAFAANDPISTKMILERIKKWNQNMNLPIIGLLNLRADRGDRTLQWIKALRTEKCYDFDYIFVSGGGATAAVRKLRGYTRCPIRVLGAHQCLKPQDVISEITHVNAQGGIIFGFGNIGGLGAVLVEHWEKVGKPICL